MPFNVVIEKVIRTWLEMTAEDHRVDHDGLGETVGRCLGLFYAGDGTVGSRDSEWF